MATGARPEAQNGARSWLGLALSEASLTGKESPSHFGATPNEAHSGSGGADGETRRLSTTTKWTSLDF